MCQILGVSLFSGSTHRSVDQSGFTCTPIPFFVGCFHSPRQAEVASEEVAASYFASSRLGKLTQGDLLTCRTRSQVVDAFVVRCGLDGWVSACVRSPTTAEPLDGLAIIEGLAARPPRLPS